MNNHLLPFKKFAADVESIAVFSITAVTKKKKTKPRVQYSKRYVCMMDVVAQQKY